MRRLTKQDIQSRIDTLLKKANSKVKVKLVGEYGGAHAQTEFRCSVHGKFYRAVGEFSSGIKSSSICLVCPKCSREASDKKRVADRKVLYLKELELKFNGTIKLVGDYTDTKTKAWHLCTVCGHKANVLPQSKLNGHGCAVCANIRRQSERGETVVVGGKRHVVEGYEARALSYLVNATGIKSKDIFALSSGKVPSISYTHENKASKKGVYSHYYFPDFFVKKTNTIYEVKSTMTLGIHVSEVYNKNRSKAKGCIAQGYNHVLVLVLRDGEVVTINNWYKKSRKSLIKYLHEECLIRNLT